MSQKPHGRPPKNVDWNDPHLESLLRKTESWKIDNRNHYEPQEVQIYVGWVAGVARSAVLVQENEHVMVLETTYEIPPGEHIRVDRFVAGNLRTTWGILIEGRPGNRAHDRENGVYVNWVQVR